MSAGREQRSAPGIWIYGFDRMRDNGTHESVNLFIDRPTEWYRIVRICTPAGEGPSERSALVETAADVVATLTEMCGGKLSNVARVVLGGIATGYVHRVAANRVAFARALANAERKERTRRRPRRR